MSMPPQRFPGPSELGKKSSSFRSQLSKEMQGECFMKIAIFTSIVAIAGIAISVAAYYMGKNNCKPITEESKKGRSHMSSMNSQSQDAERRQKEEMVRLQKLLAECRASRRGVSTPQRQYTGHPQRVM